MNKMGICSCRDAVTCIVVVAVVLEDEEEDEDTGSFHTINDGGIDDDDDDIDVSDTSAGTDTGGGDIGDDCCCCCCIGVLFVVGVELYGDEEVVVFVAVGNCTIVGVVEVYVGCCCGSVGGTMLPCGCRGGGGGVRTVFNVIDATPILLVDDTCTVGVVIFDGATVPAVAIPPPCG
jgi:hypothetical protein